jgi:hypothetical protein
MMKKEALTLWLFILAIFLIGSIGAVTYCCEKTTSGAWCQNVNSESLCSTAINPLTNEPFKKTAASCEATSYCRPGTCINGQEGICMPNTPQVVCSENYGYWSEKGKSELPQCQLGCCLIGDQAAFTTQIACNRLSALYALQINWQANINDELTCLASANPSAKGACVYTKNYVKTCELTTKENCNSKAKNSALSEVEFHASFLCTAQELGTNCAKTTQVKCDDKNDVRFVDSCGNLANIYDSEKVNDENYWTKIQEPTCGDNEGNKDSTTCGDCDYLSGSMCKKDGSSYICKDLDCKDYTGTYSGSFAYPHHGETWCASDSKTSDENAPGATYFRLICYNGEVTKEQCDSTRQKVCAETEDKESGFMFANCKVNVWQDCVSQNNSADCEDVNVRDCVWEEWNGYYFTSGGLKNDSSDSASDGMCVPKYPPGFERDGSDNVVGGDVCSIANSVCYVKYEKKWYQNDEKWKCVENCSCLTDEWENGLNAICTQIGDCGNKKNYVGIFGYQFNDIIKEEKLSE